MEATHENIKLLNAEIYRQRAKIHNELNDLFYRVTKDEFFLSNKVPNEKESE